jgi:isoprenylcysteine carboxyl methyltransferase (ICMT) family protein YpbQ
VVASLVNDFLVVKELYGLKLVPRAWYGRLMGFLFEIVFEMGKADQTLFLLRQNKDILIV